MTSDTTLDLNALGDDDLIDAMLEAWRDDEIVFGRQNRYETEYPKLRAEILRRLTAAERPVEGTVTISESDARLASSVIDSTRTVVLANLSKIREALQGLDSVQDVLETALAASSAPAAAALGQGEGTVIELTDGEATLVGRWLRTERGRCGACDCPDCAHADSVLRKLNATPAPTE